MSISVALVTSALLCTTAVLVIVRKYWRDPSRSQAFADILQDRVALAVWAAVTAAYAVGGIVWQGSADTVIPGLCIGGVLAAVVHRTRDRQRRRP